MSASQDIFNYATGALAFVSAIASVLLYYRHYLPGAQMKILDELLNETKEMYRNVEVAGLLPAGELRVSMRDNLESLELNSVQLREQVYNATTLREEYLAMIRGLSRKIMQKAHQVKRFRAYLLSASEEQKRLQMLSRSFGGGQQVSNCIAPNLVLQGASCREDTLNPGSYPSVHNVGHNEVIQLDNTVVVGCTATTAPHSPVNFSLDEREAPSRTATLVERQPFEWWSFRIPFSKLRWCFKYPQKEPSNIAGSESSAADITALPV